MSQAQVIKLQKDQVIQLTKDSNLTKGLFGLGWKPTPGAGQVDLDAMCLGVNAAGQGTELIYYGKKVGLDGSVSLSGDDLSGADDGEGANAPDEIVTIDLAIVPAEVTQLLLIVNSFRGQTFGSVKDVFVQVSDYFTHQNLVEYDLDADYSNDKGIIVAKLDRMVNDPGNWSFTAVGKGFPGGLPTIARMYGMNVE